MCVFLHVKTQTQDVLVDTGSAGMGVPVEQPQVRLSCLLQQRTQNAHMHIIWMRSAH